MSDDFFGDDFDPSSVEDAGESEGMKAAAVEAKAVLVNLEHRGRLSEADKAEIYAETDLVKRARALQRAGDGNAIKFVHFNKPNPNNPDDIGPRARKDSLLNRHAVYDALFDFGSGRVPFPYFDTYKGRLVDHEGNPFSVQNLRTRELVMALDACGMENPTDKEVADSLRSWALDHQRDSLMDHFTKSCPEWDGVSRLDTLLIDLFKPFDTELNRLVGRYFWLSLYNRITNPGCAAPVTIALIGAQDIGKSWFSVLLCRLLTGDPKSGPVELDLGAKNYNQFLRAITGRSLIANVGEMVGFKKGDLNRIKGFVTKTEDDMDFKFLDSMIKPRQWITIMDGNGYEGLQRDDTGNRRFYPIFPFQEPDKHGMPAWREGEKVDFSNFKEDLWQAMAECRDWMQEHGAAGYANLISKVNTEVQKFSMGEMSRARGVTRDDGLDLNLKQVLFGCEYITSRDGIFVPTHEILRVFQILTRREPFSRTLAPHMKSLGFEPKQKYARGWLFVGDGSRECHEWNETAMKLHIFRHGMDEDDPLYDDADLFQATVEQVKVRVNGSGAGF